MCRICKISRICNNLLIKDGFGHAQSQVRLDNRVSTCRAEHSILKLPAKSGQPSLCTKNSHKKQPKCCVLNVEDVCKPLVCESIERCPFNTRKRSSCPASSSSMFGPKRSIPSNAVNAQALLIVSFLLTISRVLRGFL